MSSSARIPAVGAPSGNPMMRAINRAVMSTPLQKIDSLSREPAIDTHAVRLAPHPVYGHMVRYCYGYMAIVFYG